MGTTDEECHSLVSRIDPLTGVLARRQWPVIVASAAPGAAIALLDRDRMKHFNMHNGYARGDEVLARLGTYLTADANEIRDVIRVGGQSFAIVWPLTPGVFERATDASAAIVAWVRSSLAPSEPARCGDAGCLGPAALTTTIALGRVRENDDPPSVFARLDEALVRGKRAGRDRLVIEA